MGGKAYVGGGRAGGGRIGCGSTGEETRGGSGDSRSPHQLSSDPAELKRTDDDSRRKSCDEIRLPSDLGFDDVEGIGADETFRAIKAARRRCSANRASSSEIVLGIAALLSASSKVLSREKGRQCCPSGVSEAA